MHVVLRELLLDGRVAPRALAVGHVEAEVGPVLVRGPDPNPDPVACAAPVGDGDCVAHAEVHRLHDTLALQLAAGPDGHGGGGHVAAGADQLLAVVVVLLHVLQPTPDGQAELLWDFQRNQVLHTHTHTTFSLLAEPDSRRPAVVMMPGDRGLIKCGTAQERRPSVKNAYLPLHTVLWPLPSPPLPSSPVLYPSVCRLSLSSPLESSAFFLQSATSVSLCDTFVTQLSFQQSSQNH